MSDDDWPAQLHAQYLSVLDERDAAIEALADLARISDEALQDGHPSIPEMARIHRRAVAALDSLAVSPADTTEAA